MLLPRKRKHGDGESQRPTDEAPRKRRPGRPLKHSKDLAPPRSVVRDKAKKIHQRLQVHEEDDERARKRSRTLSAFERLPNEIIQHIFFDSLETNLALTSRTLNEDLTSEPVFRSLILFAFFPSNYWDDDDWVETSHFLPAQYRHLDTIERFNLQRTILGFRWCSLTRIRRCLPILSRLAIGCQLQDEKPSPWTISKLRQENLPDLNDHQALRERYSTSKTSSLYEAIRPKWGRPLADQTGPDGTLPFFHVPNDSFRGFFSKENGRFRQVLGAMTIPDKALRGAPWTEEKLTLLQLLRQGLRFAGMLQTHHTGWIVSVSATALFDGMASAIEEGHRLALLSLLDLYCGLRDELFLDRTGHIPITYASDMMSTARREHSKDKLPLPSRLFHLAVELDESSASFLALLIRASVDSIPQDDEVLTAWALRQEATGTGSKLDAWLLKYMEAPDHPRYKNVFVDGARARLIPDASDEISTQDSFADELGLINRWTLSRFLDVENDAAPHSPTDSDYAL